MNLLLYCFSGFLGYNWIESLRVSAVSINAKFSGVGEVIETMWFAELDGNFVSEYALRGQIRDFLSASISTAPTKNACFERIHLTLHNTCQSENTGPEYSTSLASAVLIEF